MRITKRRLRRIIREERRNLLERGDMNARGPDPHVDYVMWPEEYVDSAAKDLLTPEEVESVGGMQKLEVLAIDLADELAYKLADSEEGFGSSDRSAELKGYIDQLGFKTDWTGPGGSLQVVREGNMRITKRQLLRIIREEAVKQTEKYDDDPALKGDQDKLPDNLQKGIIDKEEEEEEKEKNESRKLTRRQLRKMIQEQMGAAAPEIKTAPEWVEHLGQLIDQDMTERGVDLRGEGSEVVEALEMLRREYKDEMRGPTR